MLIALASTAQQQQEAPAAACKRYGSQAQETATALLGMLAAIHDIQEAAQKGALTGQILQKLCAAVLCLTAMEGCS